MIRSTRRTRVAPGAPRARFAYGLLFVMVCLGPLIVFACSDPVPTSASCTNGGSASPTLGLSVVGGTGVLLITSTTTNTVSTTGAASASASTAVQSPTPVAVSLQLSAEFSCPVQGVAHATMTTSVGQFTSGLASASAGGGGGAMDAGSSAAAGNSGVAGASVTVLLGVADAGLVTTIPALDDGATSTDAAEEQTTATSNVAPPVIVAGPAGTTLPSTLFGYTTLQVTTDRAAIVQAVVGDTSLCAQLVIDGPQNPAPVPNATVSATLISCGVPVVAQFDPTPDAGALAIGQTADGPETLPDASLDAASDGPTE